MFLKSIEFYSFLSYAQVFHNLPGELLGLFGRFIGKPDLPEHIVTLPKIGNVVDIPKGQTGSWGSFRDGKSRKT
jgi:hypothetical protein